MVIRKIFDPYFSTKTRGKEKGTGLGLAICHSIITKNGGRIEAQSPPEGGMILSVFLPARLPVQALARPHLPLQPAVAPAPPASLALPRILVLEDDESISEVLGEILVGLGQEATFTTSGEAAVAAYQEAAARGNPFSLAILDLTIRGGMGGRETMQALRQLDPNVRAVVASGYTEDDALTNFADHGFLAALKKPYDIDAIERILRLAGLAPAS